MLDRIVKFKNVIWAVLVLIALLAVLVGVLYCLVNPYPGERIIPTVELGASSGSQKKDKSSSASTPPSDSVLAEAGMLNELEKTRDHGQDYISSLTFLCDSRNTAVVTYGADPSKVWLGSEGSVDMNDLFAAGVRFPGDGSTVSAPNAAMISKPDILVILIGKDGLPDISEESFITGYKALISSVLGQSPSTRIICCSISSVTEGYTGNITPEKIYLANQWLQTVCTDTAVWYADTASVICRDGWLLEEYAASDGVSLNGAGISSIFEYLSTHALS